MDSNHHEVFIPGFAYITGVPDTCQHDYTGDWVYWTASGRTIYWHTYRQWASYCADLRDRLVHEYQISIEDPIVGGAVTCRKCKKVYTPNI